MSTPSTTLTASGDDEPGKFLALNHTRDELVQIFADNIGEEISERDLPRISLPAKNATKWTISSPMGDEITDELSGILVFYRTTRAYWPNPEPTGDLPQCKSPDGRHGYGNPGGDCRSCPFAQYGSRAEHAQFPKPGNGQACSQNELWFLLRPDALLPSVVKLPPTSLQAAKKYRVGLANVAIQLPTVVTSLRVKTEGTRGTEYAVIVPEVKDRLSKEDSDRAAAYAVHMKPMLESAAAAMANETAGAAA